MEELVAQGLAKVLAKFAMTGEFPVEIVTTIYGQGLEDGISIAEELELKAEPVEEPKRRKKPGPKPKKRKPSPKKGRKSIACTPALRQRLVEYLNENGLGRHKHYNEVRQAYPELPCWDSMLNNMPGGRNKYIKPSTIKALEKVTGAPFEL